MRLFDAGEGISADSLAYFRDHRDQLGEIVAAEVYFPGCGGTAPYCFVLRDDAGNEMWLSGATTGYAGEGPRVAMEILLDAGWPPEQARAVFSQPALRLSRSPAAAGHARQRTGEAPEGRSVPPRRSGSEAALIRPASAGAADWGQLADLSDSYDPSRHLDAS